MAKDDAATRVARGAAFLDERVPGWVSQIDVATLNIEGCRRCVLAQLGGYDKRVQEFSGKHWMNAGDWAPDHGFARYVNEPDRAFAALTAAWREQIAMRISVQHQVNVAVAAPARRPVRVA